MAGKYTSENTANRFDSACIASIIRLAYLHLLYDPIDVTCKSTADLDHILVFSPH